MCYEAASDRFVASADQLVEVVDLFTATFEVANYVLMILANRLRASALMRLGYYRLTRLFMVLSILVPELLFMLTSPCVISMGSELMEGSWRSLLEFESPK